MIMNINKTAETDKCDDGINIPEQINRKTIDDFASLFKFNKIDNKEPNSNFFGDLN